MDHPGFEVIENSCNGSVRARFFGYVPRECVKRDRVRIFGKTETSARICSVERWDEKKLVRLKLRGEVRKGDMGMWDLTPLHIRGDRLISRSCDDVVGCIALLGALTDLVSRRARADVIFVFTRAEEVGFQGALAMAHANGLSRNARVVSVENSKEILPRARMGGGPIVRVGDRAAVFDSTLTRYLSAIGEELSGRDRRFHYQRCLMDGGICEATAFGECGYQASAICIALGNYHNIGPRSRIAAEYVSLSDLQGLIRLIVVAAESTSRYDSVTRGLRDRLDGLHEQAMRRLSPTFNLLS